MAVVCATATIVFGIYPEPLFDVARDAGAAADLAGLTALEAPRLVGRRAAPGSSRGRIRAGAPTDGMRDRRRPGDCRVRALLALVGAALAGAGAAVGLARSWRPRWPTACGPASASSRATCAGPRTPRRRACAVPVRRAHARRGAAVTVASLRLGADDGWRSRGARTARCCVPCADADGGGVGRDRRRGEPARTRGRASAEVRLRARLRPRWEFPDAAAARPVPASREDRDDVEPTWRFGDAGAVLTGAADAGAGGCDADGARGDRRPRAPACASAAGTTTLLPPHAGSTRSTPAASVPGASVALDGAPDRAPRSSS